MSAKQEGPELTVKASCLDCIHESSESYAVQGDSGHDVYCNAFVGSRKRIGDSRWDTPDWCPFLVAAKQKLAQSLIDAQP